MKRKVSDILDFSGPVAFDEVEHGTYKPICPWCAEEIGKWIRAEKYGELYEQLLEAQVEHMDVCVQREATEMQVELRSGGLGFLEGG